MKVLKWLDKWLEEIFVVITLGSLSCVMMLQVIMRFVFNHALNWPEEFCRYAFMWCAFVGLSYCTKKNILLKVTLVTSLFPKKLVKVIDWFASILTLVFYFIMIYASYTVTMNSLNRNQVSSATGFPLWIAYLSGPVGFLLAVYRQVQYMIKLAKGSHDIDEPTKEQLAKEEMEAAGVELKEEK